MHFTSHAPVHLHLMCYRYPLIKIVLRFQDKFEKREKKLDEQIQNERDKLTQEETKLKMNREQMVTDNNAFYPYLIELNVRLGY